MDTASVVETIAERIERELERVRAARPALASRISRAEGILVTHLSCRRQRTIRVRVRDGRARFLVSGSGGAVYVVDPASWSCTCLDAHRHGKGCKHALACWALWRASARPVLPASAVVGTGEVLTLAEENGPYELRECPGCLDGLVYDGERGTWVGHDGAPGPGARWPSSTQRPRRLLPSGCGSARRVGSGTRGETCTRSTRITDRWPTSRVTSCAVRAPAGTASSSASYTAMATRARGPPAPRFSRRPDKF